MRRCGKHNAESLESQQCHNCTLDTCILDEPLWTVTPCLVSSQCLATIACLFVQSRLTTIANETLACRKGCLRVLHQQYVMLQPHD